MEGNAIDVSVIVACYNPDYEKLERTLISILLQKNCNYEIIIADDGSRENYELFVMDLFSKYSFSNFSFSKEEVNKGTVCNIFDALACAKGEYVKTISPGDYLYDSYTLFDLVEYMKIYNLQMCFSDAIYYYKNDSGKYKIKKRLAEPKFPFLYNWENFNLNVACQDNLIFDTYVLGAAVFSRKKLLKEYLEIIVGKVKYTEDFIIKLILADRIPVIHFPRTTVWYEYGLGVSTCSDSEWKRKLERDFDSVYDLLIERLGKSYFDIRLKILLENRNNTVKKRITTLLLFPIASIRWMINLKRKCTTAHNNVDYSFFWQIHGMNRRKICK